VGVDRADDGLLGTGEDRNGGKSHFGAPVLPWFTLFNLYGFARFAIDYDVTPFLQTTEVCWPAQFSSLGFSFLSN
jgi:hypothetical protein